MPLFKSSSQVKSFTPKLGGRSPVPDKRKVTFGITASMSVVQRPPGYHSKPHIHNCEQYCYVKSGEIWMFVKNRGYHLKQGDFLRVPPNRVHWTWNKSKSESCELLEIHSPGMQDEPLYGKNAVPLFDIGEKIVTTGSPRTFYLNPKVYKTDESEAQTQD